MKIHVRQRADRYNVIGAPKTAASRRVVPFGKVVGTTLKAWKLSPAVQERMGHSSITVTMDTYGHLFPRGDDSKVLDGTGRITWIDEPKTHSRIRWITVDELGREVKRP